MSSDEEIEKPPERRAPSGRASKGNRMSRLLAEEEEDADDADKEFYQQSFWEEVEEDGEYDAEAEDEGADSFDSDFGDSTESDDDDDDEKAEKAGKKEKAVAARKRSVYQDPKAKEKSAAGAAAPRPKSHKKRPRLDADLPPTQIMRGSLRASTQDATEKAVEKRRQASQQAAQRAERQAQGKGKFGVEMRRLTQEEILAEAAQTEIINRASLEKMLRIEEEKRKVVVRERSSLGPRIKTCSSRVGDSVLNSVTFVDCGIPAAIDDVAPRYPAPARCAVTGLPAKYLDPATGAPYATLEAFRMLRGKGTGRRNAGPSGAAGGEKSVGD